MHPILRREMNIRKAEMRDVEALARLAVKTYAAAFGASMSAGDLDAHLRKHLSVESIGRMVVDDVVLVAEIDGRMVGYVQVGKARFEQDARLYGEYELRRLYVDGEMQNKGIGAGLMGAAIDTAERAGARRIFLDVWERNAGARRFYERFGFEVVGMRAFVVESGAETDPDLIMVRITSS
jgi:diamine N-acetyltransferase